MLLSEDVNLVKNVDPDWCAIVHVSDRSSEGILEGRPKKGVAILWKNTLSSFIKPVYYNDCVIGIKILTEFNEILLLNVHLPYDGKCAESLEKFEFALSSINTLIEEANTSSVVVVGDFNANFDVGRFGRVLRNFIDERGLKIGDLGLQTDSFTYLSPGHDTTSWLDHVICSECMLRVISDVKIHYDMCLYDHFPLSFTLGLGLGHGEGKSVSDTSFVMWNKLSVNDKTKICSNLDDLILTNPILNHEANYCYNYNCKNADHLDAIQKTYAKLIQILKLSTNEFSIVHKNVKKCVPEWNEFVKDLMAGVPALIVNIVKVMYSNQFVSVKYGDKFSYKWQIGNGVRQGGILSPSLFNLYINDLINAIDNLNTGCKLGTSNANIICYADDIVLLAPSAAGLQRLVDEIVLQAGAIGLKFNVGKSVCMVFKGRNELRSVLPRIIMNGVNIELAKSTKWLGFVIDEHLSNVNDISRARNSFYNNFNGILRKFNTLDNNSMLFLFKSYCTQIYGAELWINNHGCSQVLRQFEQYMQHGLERL
ncbi:unnamed protein product [Rotaria magnacalcarata]|uniref:Reverse transcriptase domain-containing protein n=1 Tax=Rotaria magnacalcarata TaxID=392030 RepID=A0A816N3B5_9BILA|nr:unnamed protein product [Rotaria magnacalcarata]